MPYPQHCLYPLSLIGAQIDKQYTALVDNTTRAHAAEARGGTFRRAVEAV